MKSLRLYGTYPVVMAFGIALHLLLLKNGIHLAFATYIPVIAGALMVTFLEWQFPHRLSWYADKNEVLQDAIYMALIQGVFPKILSFTIALALLNILQEGGLTFLGWWPVQWPVPSQTLLMILLADGLRYWLHRWAHEWEVLWRFHAVHHSPHRLYWLNVGRFHPIDKGLQFLLDSLPFILVGVGEKVLGLYVVCYAINGFFQHCNIDMRLGLLNYVISGPELHRWHHSRLKKESNQNYGNNLIVWDLLFGTWFLPKDEQVQELGLVNRSYPMSFLEQMAVPLKRGADKQSVGT